MVNAYLESGLDRRTPGKFNETLNDLPELAQTLVLPGDPLDEICAEKFFEIIDSQIASSLSRGYSLSLILVRLEVTSILFELKDAIIRTAAQLVTLNLRPTDILLRYPTESFSLVLHDANEACAHIVAKRLSLHLAKAMQTSIKASFGASSHVTSGYDRAQKLLSSAEADLRAGSTIIL